ncbi:hypothetical protein ACH4FX_05165 [Streptomyces sp. NPDC018019]|uniref:hypothetical protein n=1 Tax=Streptomyces sp. NPDC018019 TaxID=3365030 RepID=UPI0037B5CC62
MTTEADHDTAAGIARLEGYLLLHAERDRADHEARAFADRLPWLTTAQRDEVVRCYTEQRLTGARRDWERIRARCDQLRGEYAARYEAFRSRLVRTCCAVTLTAAAVCTGTVVLSIVR